MTGALHLGARTEWRQGRGERVRAAAGATLRRAALLLLGLFVASLIVFVSLRVLPGDAAQVVAGVTATPEQVALIRTEMGADRPLWQQYAAWALGAARGDLGTSPLTGMPVAATIAERAGVTLPLIGLALLIAAAIGVPLGLRSALGSRRPGWRLLAVVAQAFASVPVVWAGILLALLFGVRLGWLPAQGFPEAGWADPADALRSLLLPALALGVVEGAVLLRYVRSSVLGLVDSDLVRAGASRGLTRVQSVRRHALPQALLTLVPVLVVQFAALLVGAVVAEELFGLPGFGRLLVADVGGRDLVAVQGELLVLTGLILVVGAAADLFRALADRRSSVRAGAAGAGAGSGSEAGR